MDPFKCPVEGSCFGKKKGGCYILTSCANHNGECAFRKEYASKPKGWEPRTKEEKEWVLKEKERIAKSLI